MPPFFVLLFLALTTPGPTANECDLLPSPFLFYLVAAATVVEAILVVVVDRRGCVRGPRLLTCSADVFVYIFRP